ncbi:MAG: hypothetical protein PHD51_02090 [Patescibacteria group bacterium]|nr:hypothetical protein [Patescibacteria group bacterium]MDD5490349.1 hypothetical protein [Patescibacteria group bacterium]
MKAFKMVVIIVNLAIIMLLIQGSVAVQSKTPSPLPEEKAEVMLAFVSCNFDTESGCPGKNQICCRDWCVPKDQCASFLNRLEGSKQNQQASNSQDSKIEQVKNFDCQQLKEIIANDPDILKKVTKAIEAKKSKSAAPTKEEQKMSPDRSTGYFCNGWRCEYR